MPLEGKDGCESSDSAGEPWQEPWQSLSRENFVGGFDDAASHSQSLFQALSFIKKYEVTNSHEETID